MCVTSEFVYHLSLYIYTFITLHIYIYIHYIHIFILYKSYIWEFNKCEVKWKVFNKLMTTLKRQLVFHGRCNFILSINHNVRQVLFQCGWSIPRNINLLRYPQSCYFETFWWLSKRDSLRKKCYSELFWSECGKMRTRITLKADTLSAVINVKRDYL